MSRKNPIIRAVEGETSESPAGSGEEAVEETARAEVEAEPALFDADEAAEPSTGGSPYVGRILAALAVIAILAWTGLYGWAIRNELMVAVNAAPSQWVRWIIDWSVPVLLVCVVWMLAMRNSTREAKRFASTAATLSEESAQLEERLSVVNRELSLAREFLASQSRDLETLGRIAAERLSTNASELQDLIQTNGAQVEAIGTASDTALANMTRLRDDLPVITASARDVNNQIGSTGRTAREQLEKLISGFERLNQFGSASENQVTALTSQIDKTLSGFESQLAKIEQTLAARFTALQNQAAQYRGSISDTEAEALAAMNERITLLQTETRAISGKMRDAEAEALEQMRASKARWEEEIAAMVERLSKLDLQAAQASRLRIKELNEEAGRFDDKLEQRDVHFFEEITRRQSDFETREVQATELLAQRLSKLDDELAEKREAQIAQTEKLAEHGDAMVERVNQLGALMTEVAKLGDDTRAGLGEGMGALSEQLDAKRASLLETEASLNKLTEASIRMLEIIQSGAKHSREDLPSAIETASLALEGLEARSTKLSGSMFTIGQKGEDLASYLIQTNEGIEQADATLESLQARVADRSEEALAQLNGLRGGLERLAQDTETYAGETQGALIEALNKLEEATKATIETLDESARSEVTGLAEKLSGDAVAALERALRNDSAETIGKLEQAASHASGVGREATIQLRDQLARVNELTGNLEQRVARARELAEEQVGNDFARRMALITDSLNSASIDLSNALSSEVPDTAWHAYLKGDRGIFTRRAVRLVESGDARAIADLYQNDDDFQATVNRYIHDFEAMLRSMLSTRDGNALSVTILGSDMGKLYVALAQSIERFRK
ncbi:MAG: ATPase [Pseudomonadota bacterium]